MIDMRVLWIVFFWMVGFSAAAQTVVATTAVRSQTILTPAHLAVIGANVAGGVSDPALLVGLETRVTLYPNRPIMLQDVGAPRIIDRNEIVALLYNTSGLRISVEGRSLGVAGMGDVVRVMNLGSRAVVSGVVEGPGQVRVGGGQ